MYQILSIKPETPYFMDNVVPLYQELFTPDERYPLSDVVAWLSARSEIFHPRCWGMVNAQKTLVGFCCWAWLPFHRFGYLMYLGCRPEVKRDRERWRGEAGERDRWLLTQVFTEIERLGEKSGAPARLTFWEARSPFEPKVQSLAKIRRLALIRIFQSAGAVCQPMDYLVPPVGHAQPPVPYIVMARTHPHAQPARNLTKDEALEVAFTGLCEMNNGMRGDLYHQRVTNSIERMWQADLDQVYTNLKRMLGEAEIAVALPMSGTLSARTQPTHKDKR